MTVSFTWQFCENVTFFWMVSENVTRTNSKVVKVTNPQCLGLTRSRIETTRSMRTKVMILYDAYVLVVGGFLDAKNICLSIISTSRIFLEFTLLKKTNMTVENQKWKKLEIHLQMVAFPLVNVSFCRVKRSLEVSCFNVVS